jgi:hypothetical protein
MNNISVHNGNFRFLEARQLEKNGSRLISAKMASRLLVEPARPDNPLLGIGKFWTGTIVAYPKSRCRFTHAVQLVNRPHIFVLDTQDYVEDRNIALAFQDFRLREEGREIHYIPGNITVVENFPQESGWCSLDENGVPTVDGRGHVYLYRWDDARVGPMVISGQQSPEFFLQHRPSERFTAVLAENDFAAPRSSSVPASAEARN